LGAVRAKRQYQFGFFWTANDQHTWLGGCNRGDDLVPVLHGGSSHKSLELFGGLTG
jgi:hypothetical protein